MSSGGGRALGLLFLHSMLMVTLPFGAFYYVQSHMQDADPFKRTCYSVGAAVAAVNLIIASFCWIAWRDERRQILAQKTE